VLREVQERLYNFNYEIGVLSGQMTEETHNAIWAWQRYVKRAPTGELADAEPANCAALAFPPPFGAFGLRGRRRQRSGLGPAVAPGSRQRRPRRQPRAGGPRQLQGLDGCSVGLRRARFLNGHGASHDPLGCLRHRARQARAGHGPCAQRVPGPGQEAAGVRHPPHFLRRRQSQTVSRSPSGCAAWRLPRSLPRALPGRRC